MDNTQAFWDVYRKKWRATLRSWKDGQSTSAWTKLIIQAAKEACNDFAQQVDRKVKVGSERHGRIDVHAIDERTGKLLVAFESELAYWGYKSTRKDWREEFRKLCQISAELRVLSSTFKPGTGAGFSAFLKERLDSMRASFDNGIPGDFCLIFGPENTWKDPNQHWLAYSLERDFTLRELTSAKPLIPRLVMHGTESSIE